MQGSALARPCPCLAPCVGDSIIGRDPVSFQWRMGKFLPFSVFEICLLGSIGCPTNRRRLYFHQNLRLTQCRHPQDRDSRLDLPENFP